MGHLVALLISTLVVGSAAAEFALAQGQATVSSVPGEERRQEREDLESEKLRAEIRKLELENQSLDSPTAFIGEIAPATAVIVAVVSALLAVFRYLGEQKLARVQREAENRQHLEERFATVSGELGSESGATRVGAAVALLTFLTAGHRVFHEQLFYLLVENLKLEYHDLKVKRILVRGLEKAFRQGWTPAADAAKLDLARAHLQRIDLSDLSLAEGDVAFANLKHATLSRCRLFRLKGYRVQLTKASLTDADLGEARLRKAECQGAHFHRAKVVAADLKEADLKGAEFYGARLQSAHFEGANLKRASF